MSSLAGQTYAFLMTIFAGGIIGLLFDVYRVIRSVFQPRQLGTAVWDLVFWIMVTPVLFATLLASNWGELRFYVAIGVGLGLLLYFQAMSPWVIWFLVRTIRGIGYGLGKFVRKTLRVITFPFVLMGIFDRYGARPYPRFRYRPREAWRKFSFKGIFSRPG